MPRWLVLIQYSTVVAFPSTASPRILINSGIAAPKSTYFCVLFPACGPVNSNALPRPGNALGLPRSESRIAEPKTPSKPGADPRFGVLPRGPFGPRWICQTTADESTVAL